jgi:LEA14-like dessication related protein
MQNKKNIFKRRNPIGFLLFVSFCLVLSSCSVYKDAEIYMTIDNPNWYKIKLTESHVSLYFEGKPMGEVLLSEPIVIPKKSVSTQIMKVHGDYDDLQGLLGNVLALIFKQSFQVEAKGYIQGKAMFVAKKVDINFQQAMSKEDLGF